MYVKSIMKRFHKARFCTSCVPIWPCFLGQVPPGTPDFPGRMSALGIGSVGVEINDLLAF